MVQRGQRSLDHILCELIRNSRVFFDLCIYSTTIVTSRFLPSSCLKRLWIGSNTRSLPSSITSDPRCMNVTPMYYAETSQAQAPRAGEEQEKSAWPCRVFAVINLCFTAFIRRPITTRRKTVGVCGIAPRGSGDTHRETVLPFANVNAF